MNRTTEIESETPWLRMKEAAAYMRISVAMLYKLRKSDPTFPARLIGGQTVRFSKPELDTWIAKAPTGFATTPKRRKAETAAAETPVIQ